MVHQPQHWCIQVFQNLFSFFLISNSIQALYQQSRKQLLCEVIKWGFVNYKHKLFALASLVHNSNKVLRESQWDVSQRSLKNVNQNVGKGAAQFVSTSCDSIFMLGKIANNLIQGDQAVHSFRKVPVFKTLDVFCDVVYFLLQHWVQHFLFRLLSFEGFSILRLGFDLIKLLNQFQVIISVVLLVKFLGKKILLLRLCTS